MASEYPKDNFGIPRNPFVIAAAYMKQKMRDMNSPENKALQDLLTPVEAAERMDNWNKVDEMWSFYHDLYEKAKEGMPDLNRLKDEFNRMREKADREFQFAFKSAEKKVKSLKIVRERALQKVKETELAYRPVNVAHQVKKREFQPKKVAMDRIERSKTELSLIATEQMKTATWVIVWAIRAVLGIALALSLGLIIGALNQYKPFTWQLWFFWFIASAVLFNSGTVVYWLGLKAAETAEAKRHRGAVVPLGNKWLWMLLFILVLYSNSDAMTMMFGAFRLQEISGNKIPLPILYLVCFIFVFPYLCMEAKCGWKEGERKVREHVLDVLDEDEKDVEGVILDPSIEEEVELEKLKVVWEQASAGLAEIDAEIDRIRSEVKRVYFQPPVDFAVGTYENEGGLTVPIQLAEFIEPNFNESVTIALRRFWKCVEEAETFDTEIKQKALAREAKQKMPRLFQRGRFSRWRSR